MVVIERKPGQGVVIGTHVLKVLAVHGGEVVVALLDPEKDCLGCGEPGTERWRCLGCGLEALVCVGCSPGWGCPRCPTAG